MRTAATLRPFVLPFIALLFAALPTVAAAPPDGAGTARTAWPKGFPAEESFFPLAVWLQSPRNAERYKGLGINTYVALWRGPTDEQLDALDKAGMHLVS